MAKGVPNKRYTPQKEELSCSETARQFEAKKPNRKWVTDGTEFSLFGQRLYLSPILDPCSREIVSSSISDRPVLPMVPEMPDKAFALIPS